MAEYGEGSMLHLTGVWQGRYTYPHHMPPVSFVATLIETATRLSGSTHEPGGSLGLSDAIAYATLVGSRQGSKVDFIKTYSNGGSEGSLPIAYSGVLNLDATEIAGTWRIPGYWSGNFLMIRSAGKAVHAKRKAVQRI
jgi:hypothetical protein